MKATKIIITAVLLAITSVGYSQKGVGNKEGVARVSAKYEIEQFSGELQNIINEACTQTTGQYSKGTHLMVKTDKETLNMHLGPTIKVSDMTNKLKTGDKIQLKVFTTKDMPDNHYIVKEFTSQGETHKIRNSNLKPFWAGEAGKGRKKRK